MTNQTTAYEDIKEEIGDSISHLFDQLLSESMAMQSPEGIEPEKNGDFSGMINRISKNFTPPSFQQCEEENFSLQVGLFKPKTQEGPTGSDYAVVFEVFDKNSDFPKKSKTTLVQAKVGSALSGVNTKGSVSIYDKHCKDQLETIGRLTPNDGFLLIYTDSGCYCVNAEDALKKSQGKGTFRFDKADLMNAGTIGKELAICNKGNVREISPVGLGVARNADNTVNLNDFVAKLTAFGVKKPSTVINIVTTIKPSLKQKNTLGPKKKKPK